MDEPESLIVRLRKRAEIRRQIPDRKSVQNGEPDRLADLLDEAADELEEAARRLEEATDRLDSLETDYANSRPS